MSLLLSTPLSKDVPTHEVVTGCTLEPVMCHINSKEFISDYLVLGFQLVCFKMQDCWAYIPAAEHQFIFIINTDLITEFYYL